jgi:hypothetical protein
VVGHEPVTPPHDRRRDTLAETKDLPWKVDPDTVRTDHEIASCQARIAGIE